MIAIESIECTWRYNSIRDGNRQIVINLSEPKNEHYDCNCDSKSCSCGECIFYNPRLPKGELVCLAREPNPIPLNKLKQMLYDLYKFNDIVAICITGGEPFSPQHFDSVKKLIQLFRANTEEDIEFIIETTGYPKDSFIADIDFFADNNVSILFKVPVPSKVDNLSNVMFESMGNCLSEIVSRRMGGDWLNECVVQLCIKNDSDVNIAKTYIDLLYNSFSQSTMATDLVDFVVQIDNDLTNQSFEEISGLCSYIANKFDSMNIRLLYKS